MRASALAGTASPASRGGWPWACVCSPSLDPTCSGQRTCRRAGSADGGGNRTISVILGVRSSQSLQTGGGTLLTCDPGVLDVGSGDVDVLHRGGDPGVPERGLDRGQIHP